MKKVALFIMFLFSFSIFAYIPKLDFCFEKMISKLEIKQNVIINYTVKANLDEEHLLRDGEYIVTFDSDEQFWIISAFKDSFCNKSIMIRSLVNDKMEISNMSYYYLPELIFSSRNVETLKNNLISLGFSLEKQTLAQAGKDFAYLIGHGENQKTKPTLLLKKDGFYPLEFKISSEKGYSFKIVFADYAKIKDLGFIPKNIKFYVNDKIKEERIYLSHKKNDLNNNCVINDLAQDLPISTEKLFYQTIEDYYKRFRFIN
ncbi:MAG: hypothetical protein ABIA04_02735 [Pseudomonadota bacterium]